MRIQRSRCRCHTGAYDGGGGDHPGAEQLELAQKLVGASWMREWSMM